MKISEMLDYDNGSLVWKVSRGSVAKGKIAGCRDDDGYILVRINTVLYKAHRVVWELFNGVIQDGYQVDHINGIEYDNRIENLRLVNNADNSKNKTIRKGNKSGCNGVTWSKRDSKWMAQIMINGKNIYLVRTIDIDEAITARKEAEIKYGFHENNNRRKRAI